ncbi:hypothetical protein AVEN_8480-1 [Araneus ventricosus]|uniref:Uncharacterized protein n=1 Tax=Araneus ventricosus TaxID=182803 RepID=A0A4Y1ZL50_ARAVE|nr:hypothetical protein AVEN_8480-1 [Araneus ventricosus]
MYLLREVSGRGQVIGYQDSCLSTRAIATAVIQMTRMLRQGGGRPSFCGCDITICPKVSGHLQIFTFFRISPEWFNRLSLNFGHVKNGQ